MEFAKRIVVVGGGFAGVTLAQRLEQISAHDVEIVVIGAENHMVFTPMLPEVVGRTVSPLHIVVAGRQLTRRTRWVEAKVCRVDRPNNEVHYQLSNQVAASMIYTHLIFACGSMVSLEEIPGLNSRGYPLKTLTDAILIGNDLIGNFETAAAEPNPESRRRLLTVVVIGGGFSGVEVAGHLADLMQAMQQFYPELSQEHPRVILLQRGDRLLPELNHEKLSAFTLKKLRQNGVEVRLETSARLITSTAVQLTSEEQIDAAMVVCTIGTQTLPVIKALELSLEKGRLKTDPDMRVSGTANLWALGDCASITNAFDNRPCPATAQFAVQQARQLSGNLQKVMQGKPTLNFVFRPRGMLASIGHRNAVAIIYGVKLSGFLAWFLWRGIYLWKLPGLSRRIEVAVDWAWSIFFAPNLVQLRWQRSGSTGHAPARD